MSNYCKHRFVIGSDAWVPISPPVAMGGFGIRNVAGDVLYMRTDPVDPMTEDDLQPGTQEVVPTVARAQDQWLPRFASGHPVLYVRSLSSTTIVVTWVS